jgi:hypothetical protein
MLEYLYTIEVSPFGTFDWFRCSYYRPTFEKAGTEALAMAKRHLEYNGKDLPIRVVRVAIEDVPEHHAKIWRNWKEEN